ncbi:phospholipase D-like domain-containing protein [Frateuria hangzhouensis]|uniref:phospholipase D-like domain-containing protein n=1 Tax=Frateuria hangzhouensis TaxID=2995589 RepID=UPI002260EADA|nr:phospholipase D-like domain-containing protein [Frateuria sp. STR12]MCX7514103.1 phospholipase D-like domain-containing protein [Frateuria sp. STR12]
MPADPETTRDAGEPCPPPRPRWKRRLLWAGLGAFAALVLGVLALNLVPQTQQLVHPLGPLSPVDSPQFRREIGNLLGPAIVEGNAVEDFQNGAEIFPAMLEAIRSAQHSVDMETYIYWSGRIAEEFVAALTERARAGVRVHVIADWVGSTRMQQKVVDALRAGGVHFEYFHPLRWYDIDRINNRTHRKLLIVDGRVAFTGGVGIADEWDGHGNRPDIWRDMQIRVTGPGALQMQAVFEDNWITTTGQALLGPDYYPAVPAAGDVAVQTVASSPEGGGENLQLMYLMAINGARRSIDLEAAYFVPDELTMSALKRALERGVRIRLVVPGPYVDSEIISHAAQTRWGEVLKAGGRIYRFQPAMFHNKLMIVDGYLTIAGSANFDNRSFSLNDESNIVVFDRDFATHMTEVVDRDIARSKALSLEQWRHRPWTRRMLDWLSALGAAQY